MAAGIERRVRDRLKAAQNGHNFECFIPVTILVGMKREPYRLDFNTTCPNMSTSWRLSISYQQEVEMQEVNCFVTVDRTDTGLRPVFVQASIAYVDAQENFIRYPKVAVYRVAIAAGRSTGGGFSEPTHPGFRSYISNLSLDLKVSVFVRNCHFDRESSSAAEKLKCLSKI